MDNREVREVWDFCLQKIAERLDETTFRTWFRQIEPLSFDGEKLILCVPSDFFAEYLDSNFGGLLQEVFTLAFGKMIRLIYSFQNQVLSKDNVAGKPATIDAVSPDILQYAEIEKATADVSKTGWRPNLISHFYFENFSQGESNKVPLALAQAVCEKPGHPSMNPFFIFGPPGVGKTHLMNAIGWQIVKMHPEKRVLYISTSQFLDQFTAASRNHKVSDFMRFYQQVDVLLIDDIQGLAGKEKTQDAFFDIFNHLFNLQKQIVMTCDKAPSSLSGMHERLVSRIRGSLSTEITRPDTELRRTILENKMHKEGVQLSPEVIDYVVKYVDTNVREIHGTVLSLIFNATISGKEITLEYAKDVVKSTCGREEREVNMEHIQKIVCEQFEVKPQDIQSKSRRQDIVQARQLVMFFTKKYTSDSLSVIGESLGGRKHTTVMHACQVISDTISVNPKFASKVASIEHLLRA